MKRVNGRFFSREESDSPHESGVVYRYLRVSISHPFHYEPIYLLLNEQGLTFYLSGLDSLRNGPVLSLPFSDYLHQRGTLSRNVNEVLADKRSIGELLYGGRTEAEKSGLNVAPITSRYYVNQPDFPVATDELKAILHAPEEKISFNLSHVFRDFLFEVVHTQTFADFPHYERMMMVFRENTLMNTLLAKFSYYYHKDLWQQQADAIKTEKITEPNEIVKTNFLKSESDYVSVLMEAQTAAVVKQSPWFLADVEEEIPWVWSRKTGLDSLRNETRADKRANLLAEKSLLAEPARIALIDTTSEWLMERFNSFAARQLSLRNNFWHWSFHGLIFVLLATWLVFRTESWDSLMVMGIGIGALVFGLFAIGIGHSFRLERPFPFANLVNLRYPKLGITLFATWLGYSSTVESLSIDASFRYADWGFGAGWFVFTLLVVFVIFFYLNQQLKRDMPDLAPRKIRYRVWAIIGKTYLWSMIMGALIMDVGFVNAPTNEKLEKFYHNQLFSKGYQPDSTFISTFIAELDEKQRLVLETKWGKDSLKYWQQAAHEEKIPLIYTQNFNRYLTHLHYSGSPNWSLRYQEGKFALYPGILLISNTFVLLIGLFLGFVSKGVPIPGILKS